MFLYIVRHGATEWNLNEGRYCGCRDISDIDLSPLGKKQAEALGERLREAPLKAVYSSPLKRAVETARRPARLHKLDVAIINELRERNYGQWEGLTLKEIDERFPGGYEGYEKDPGSFRPPDGETGFEVGERVVQAVALIAERHEDQAVALAAHEAVNRILLCRLLGLSVSDYRRKLVQSNASLTIVECHEGQGKLLLYNDTSHLAHLQ